MANYLHNRNYTRTLSYTSKTSMRKKNNKLKSLKKNTTGKYKILTDELSSLRDCISCLLNVSNCEKKKEMSALGLTCYKNKRTLKR